MGGVDFYKRVGLIFGMGGVLLTLEEVRGCQLFRRRFRYEIQVTFAQLITLVCVRLMRTGAECLVNLQWIRFSEHSAIADSVHFYSLLFRYSRIYLKTVWRSKNSVYVNCARMPRNKGKRGL